MNEDKIEIEQETTQEDAKYRLRTIVSDTDVTDLRKESEEVSLTEIQSEEMQELTEALRTYVRDNYGLGMAAVQLGVHKRVFVMRKPFNSQRIVTMINPKVLRRRGKSRKPEGCFSIPTPNGVQGAVVERATEIYVEFTDEEGVTHTEEMMMGMDARIFQHELDHLDGHLMLDDKTPTGKFRGWRR